MRILFLQPLMFVPGYQTVNGELKSTPSLGLLYIASVAREFGEVEFEYVSSYNIVEVVTQSDPDVVCFSVMTTQYPIIKELCKTIKQIDGRITIILGGYHPTFMFDSILDEAPVDYIVVGEGERTFRELMGYLKDNKGSPKDIRGLAFRRDGETIFTGHRKLIDKLDEVSFPARDIMPEKSKTVDFITSRGCPFSCEFCSISSFYDRRFRRRSVENVIKEVETLVEQGYRRFNIGDDNFLADFKFLKEICKKLEKLDIRFACGGRIDVIYRRPEILRILRDAGCDAIALGLESGIQEGLDALNKGITIEQVRVVANELENFDDMTRVWFLIVGTGDENDTEPKIRESVDFALSLPCDIIQPSILTPYPGTRLFNRLMAENRILTYDWSKYDCCHCVYQPLGIAPEELEHIWSESFYRIIVNRDILKLKKLNMLRDVLELSPGKAIYFVGQIIHYLANGKNIYALFERGKSRFEKRIQKEVEKASQEVPQPRARRF